MSETGITVGLVIAVIALGWLIYRVVGTLSAGSETSARADTNAVGSLPASEQIDTEMARAKNQTYASTQ
jgi:hypothetical protein